MTVEAPAAVWSMDRAIAEMIEAGAFGAGAQLEMIEPDSQRTGQDQYASTVYFGTVLVRDRQGDRHSHQLVFKLKHRMAGLRDLYQADSQFHNEILFYERIVPFFRTAQLATDRVPSLANYFYGRNGCADLVDTDMIVLENESTRGYRLSEQRLYLDLDHMIVTLKTLAKLHGLSYRAKHEDPVRFAEMMADVKECNLHSDGNYVLPGGDMIFNRLLTVALDRLTERGLISADDSRVHSFRRNFVDDMKQTLHRVINSHGPLAILCHGDYNRNNLLFRYDDTGRPVDALAFDLANVRYGSPALDLSFLLYMNTDRRLRDEHWDELLDTYCAALAEAVSDAADVVRVPDRSQVDAEMRVNGIYGLAHVSFFMRITMEESAAVDPSLFVEMATNQTYEILLSFGGIKATDVIADAVQHYLDTYCN